MDNETKIGNCIFDRTSQQIVAYIGRDKNIYEIKDNYLLVIHDNPGGPNPFTVMIFRDGLMTLGAHTDQEAITLLKKDRKIYKEDENRTLIELH